MNKPPGKTVGRNVTGNIGVNVAEAIAVIAETPLIFGYIEPGSSSGTVTITTSDHRTSSGKVKLLDGIFERAQFIVRGSPNRSYSMQVPKTLTFKAQDALLLGFEGTLSCQLKNILNKNPAPCPKPVSNLVAQNFTTFSTTDNKETAAAHLDRGGLDRVYMGGTLIVPDNAAPGLYSALVPITVSY